MGPHAPGRARPKCRYPPLAGGCAAEPRAEHSWAAPRGGGGGAPGVWREQWPPLEGAGVVVHEETVAQLRSYPGQRPQVPYQRVPAMSRQAHKLKHHLVASREERVG